MGYDCTLHAVDEKYISQNFVQTLLQYADPKHKADDDSDAELWRAAVKSLANDPPAESAPAICQLALIYASKLQPYQYQRGFALALWPDLENGVSAQLPAEFSDSPEVLFSHLLKKYPQLSGHFPRDFSGNWSTGIFIPAKKISKALRWIEKKIGEFDESERDIFDGVLLVLKHCARHKLAYWEGTDLPIPMAEMPVENAAADSFKWPDDAHYCPAARHGNVFVCQGGSSREDSRTPIADFSTWPPAIEWLPEFNVKAAFSLSGKLATVAAVPGKTYFSVRLRLAATANTPMQELAVADRRIVGDYGYDECWFFGEQVVAMLGFQKGKTPDRHPLFQEGALLVPDKTFRPARDRHVDPPDSFIYKSDYEFVRHGTARTGSGAEVFIWGDHGFEKSTNGFKKTFDLGIAESHNWSTVPAGPDGFFFVMASNCPVDNQRPVLHEINRGGTPVPHLPRLTYIIAIQPGPDNSILLHEGRNKARDIGKFYWPQTRQITRLPSDLLPGVKTADIYQLHWLEEKRMLVAFCWEQVWSIPWPKLEKLPRAAVR